MVLEQAYVGVPRTLVGLHIGQVDDKKVGKLKASRQAITSICLTRADVGQCPSSNGLKPMNQSLLLEFSPSVSNHLKMDN